MRHHENHRYNFNSTTFPIMILCFSLAGVAVIVGLALSVAPDSPSHLAGYIVLAGAIGFTWLGMKFRGYI